MAIDNLEERLAAQQEEYASTPAASPQGSDELPEDGDYQALVKGFEFFESKKNVAYLKAVLEVTLDQQYSGWEVPKIWQLEPRADQSQEQWRKSLSFLKGDLRTLGIPSDTPLTEIRPGSQVLNEILDVPVAIAVRTSDRVKDDGTPYRNVYINERLGGPLRSGGEVPADTSDLQQQAAAVGDTDIPF